MAEEVKKQELKQTSGTFNFSGIISNFDKNQKVDGTTRKNTTMRSLSFNIDTAEGHTHKLQLRAYQTENVYFSMMEVKQDGSKENHIQQVKWNDRQKFVDKESEKGYLPIDRVKYHYGTNEDDKGNKDYATFTKLTFDAIPDILQEFKVGDSVRVVGNIEIEDYDVNGETRTAVRLVPTSIFHSKEPIDFKAQGFSECANFSQRILVDEINQTGTDEYTVTGLIIGNQRIGRQDFIFRGDALKNNHYDMVLPRMAKYKKYVAMTVRGVLNNSVEQEKEPEMVEIMGVKVPVEKARPTGNSFVREFLVQKIVTDGDGKDFFDENATEYNEQNVQEFIDTFVRARKEFGKNKTEEEDTDATDYGF